MESCAKYNGIQRFVEKHEQRINFIVGVRIISFVINVSYL